MHPLRQRMLEDMQIRPFAAGTRQAYLQAVSKFARYFGRCPDQLGPDDIRAYQVHLVQEQHVGWGVLNTTVSALRFLYHTTLHPVPTAATSVAGRVELGGSATLFRGHPVFASSRPTSDGLRRRLASLGGGATAGGRY